MPTEQQKKNARAINRWIGQHEFLAFFITIVFASLIALPLTYLVMEAMAK
jgi:hypothetical protein|tara:strand:- start:6408 stop:6557 length:150 start_codon:yes stop_codon:yes gene_type:complete